MPRDYACAVVFDVDGVLLELTRPEEEIFFTAMSRYVPTENLSRDWSSYRIRNDDDIISEILERCGLPDTLKPEIITHYISVLNHAVASGAISTLKIPGADALLEEVPTFATIGIATANLQQAAKLRLQAAGIWNHVSAHAFGADGGGHKHAILARALKSIDAPKSRTIYIGDNVNDVVAGRENGVHFIGFSTDAERRQQLTDAGATFLAQNHRETLGHIRQILAC
jgi:phosphoglycolate phosphatase-like HAD superfamily hydrolase